VPHARREAGTTERARGRTGLALNLAPQGEPQLLSLCSPNEHKLRRKRQVKTRVRDQEGEEKHMPQSKQLAVLVLGSGISSLVNRLTRYVDINMFTG
jgi:hypothetical protein